MQNDLSIKIAGIIQYQKNNNNINDDLIKIITSSIYNYIQAIKDLFIEQKIFLKILPNFLTFISQCSILMNNKIKETMNFIKNENSLNKDNIQNFEKYKELYNNYFKKEGEFYNNIINIYDNEKFLINDEKQNEEFKNILLTLLNSLQNL